MTPVDGEVPHELAEAAEPVVGLVEGRLLAQDRAFQHRREHRTVARALEPGKGLCHEDSEVRVVGPGDHLDPVDCVDRIGRVVRGGRGRSRSTRTTARRAPSRGWLDAFEPLVEQELVARGREERRRGRLDPETDHAAVELAAACARAG